MTYSEIGFILLIASFLIQCFYLFYFSARVAFIKEKKSLEKNGITVIICARNENENLKKNLPLVLNQKYDDFEVVVVNDYFWILIILQSNRPNGIAGLDYIRLF